MARARLLLFSAVILFALAPGAVTQSAQLAPSPVLGGACPLAFRVEDSVEICASGGAAGGIFTCCQLAMARAMSEFANSTGRLYLGTEEAKACKTEYERAILPTLTFGSTWCPSIDEKFMAIGTAACHVARITDLVGTIQTDKLALNCPSRQLIMSECNTCGEQIVLLSSNSDCIVASQLFLAARNTSLQYWRLLTACIQYRFSVPIPPGLLAENLPVAVDTKKGAHSVVAIAIAIPVVLVVFLIAGLAAFILLRKRQQRSFLTLDDMKSVRLSGQKGLREVRLAELRAATNNFSEQNRIGKGGTSDVYRGVLADGSVVAVKKLVRDSRQEDRQFVNEMEIYGSLQHPNLAELYGFCQEDNELILVQEYMSNGSLEDVLFGDDSNVDLTWDMCVSIIMGVANGLTYLHEQVAGNGRDRIIHRDIKPGNVLLDDDYNVRLADFGVAKSLSTHQTHVTTKVMGTFGYLAPEYASSGKLTDKSDVYSFGVLMLVTMSKRQPASEEIASLQPGLVSQSFSLAREARTLQLVSLSYRGQFQPEQAERMVLVGLLCVQPDPSDRPTMSQVILMLEGRMDVPDVPIPSHQATSSIPGMRRLAPHDTHGGSTILTSSLATDSRQFSSVASQGTAEWNSGEILRSGDSMDRTDSGPIDRHNSGPMDRQFSLPMDRNTSGPLDPINNSGAGRYL